jgi:hypothetical protein
MSLQGKELILGVSGSIAAYKAVFLLRELVRLGARVTVSMTEHARAFVEPLTFRTLSGRPVLVDLFDPQSTSRWPSARTRRSSRPRRQTLSPRLRPGWPTTSSRRCSWPRAVQY